jgi:2-polyprenyl-3-methyl-5-hydroxy-6-metoxy-1,4-benzoquinol methylase
MAEIGTYKGAGLKMFRDYFPNASIYGFDNSLELINHCRSINLDQTYIEYIDVNLVDEITRAFEKTGQSFDIIIDDSSHHVQHQANVIKSCFDFLKPGGMMIIEDIFNDKRAPEMVFENALEDIISELALVTFLYPDNKNIYTGSWNNEKMLLLIKN